MSEEKEKEKENVLARGVASAIKPTQILPQWGGTGKQRTRSAQRRVTLLERDSFRGNKPSVRLFGALIILGLVWGC